MNRLGIARAGLECAAVAGYVYAVVVLLLVRDDALLCLLTLAGGAGWGWLARHRLRCGGWGSLAALAPGLLALLSLGTSVLALVSLLE